MLNTISSMKNIPLKKFIPGIAWFFVVLFLISLPKDDMPDVGGWWGWLSKIYIDKWIHVGIFAILGLLFMLPFTQSNMAVKTKWQYLVKISIAVSIWGFITELIQLMVPGRSFDLLDWIADSAGGIAALFFCKKYFLHRRLKQS